MEEEDAGRKEALFQAIEQIFHRLTKPFVPGGLELRKTPSGAASCQFDKTGQGK